MKLIYDSMNKKIVTLLLALLPIVSWAQDDNEHETFDDALFIRVPYQGLGFNVDMHYGVGTNSGKLTDVGVAAFEMGFDVAMVFRNVSLDVNADMSFGRAHEDLFHNDAVLAYHHGYMLGCLGSCLGYRFNLGRDICSFLPDIYIKPALGITVPYIDFMDEEEECYDDRFGCYGKLGKMLKLEIGSSVENFITENSKNGKAFRHEISFGLRYSLQEVNLNRINDKITGYQQSFSLFFGYGISRVGTRVKI